MLFKSDVPRSARKLVTKVYRRRLFSKFMPRISRFTRRRKLGHCVSKEGWLAPKWIAKLKRARYIYIYILRGWRGGYNGAEGRGGWLNDRGTMTKFLVDCVPLWTYVCTIPTSFVVRDYRRPLKSINFFSKQIVTLSRVPIRNLPYFSNFSNFV